jgi:hypothetical protein
VDHQFQKAGFDKERLFYTQGDYGLWQCSVPCHKRTYDNKERVVKMLLSQGFAIGQNSELTAPLLETGKQISLCCRREYRPALCPIARSAESR